MGILTNRDLRFEKDHTQLVSAVMTKANLVTVPVGTTLEDAEKILQKHRIEKLLVVDQDFNLKGLITVKDIQKKLEFPRASKDSHGRLITGAAVGYDDRKGKVKASLSGFNQTLIEQWDGTSWTIVTSPNTGAFSISLSIISLPSLTWSETLPPLPAGASAGRYRATTR